MSVPVPARQTVAVVGSGTHEHQEDADAIGDLLTRLGVNLLTGGGAGVMRSVSRAFTSRPRKRGVCIGIIPCTNESDRATPKAGYPNEYVEIAIYTHLPYSGDRGTEDLSRNHINVLSGSAIVALPGEAGTVSELVLAVRYGKPVIAFSHSPALIRGFPSAVRQVERIELVTQFLQQHIGV